jgi:hypothetical protein
MQHLRSTRLGNALTHSMSSEQKLLWGAQGDSRAQAQEEFYLANEEGCPQGRYRNAVQMQARPFS